MSTFGGNEHLRADDPPKVLTCTKDAHPFKVSTFGDNEHLKDREGDAHPASQPNGKSFSAALGEGAPVPGKTPATNGCLPQSREVPRPALGPSDDGDMPTALRRCHHCGKPGAERWDLNERDVYLHAGCTDAWSDQQERALGK